MIFTLHRWDFDLDSATLCPVRCTHLDALKKFQEFEASIRASTVDSAALARNFFQNVARKRTGDMAIDAKCGDKFNDEGMTLSHQRIRLRHNHALRMIAHGNT